LSKTKLDRSAGTTEIVDLIQRYGVDINRISRVTGQHKETVRFRYNSAIKQKGMKLEAAINEVAFGLRPVGAKVTLSSPYLPQAQRIWRLMYEFCYLRSADSSLTDDSHFLRWAVSSERVGEFKELVLELKDARIFEDVELYEFKWFRRTPMATQYYDFVHERWNFDWDSFQSVRTHEEPDSIERIRFDTIDLLLAIELQIDAGRSMMEINGLLKSRYQIEVNYKTLQYHYSSHLIKKGLVRDYVVGWQGAQARRHTAEPRRRMRQYVMVGFIARRLSGSERDILMDFTSKTPFTWAEAGGNDYLARCAFPVEMATDALEYMRDALGLLRGKAQYYLVDQRDSEIFPMNERLWDVAKSEWRFDKETILTDFKKRLTH
jgi:hypothetical protein